eukprot:m.145576 g.145576  ORF g.145576 m.145576 type:complete len:413 (-) comp17226_c0_seq4:25-1263(-)
MERPNGKHKRRRVGSLPPHDEGERLTASPHPPRCSSAASCTRAADSGSTGGGLPGGRLAWTHADCSSAAMVLHHDLWLALCPNLSVTDGNGAVRTRLDEKPGEEGSSTTTQPGTATTFDGRNPRASAAADSVRTHGHCAFPVSDVEAAEHEQVAATTSAPTVAAALRPSLPTDVVPRLAEGMKNLVSQGWHPVWAFVYDEAWELFQAVGRHVLPSINPLLKLNWDCWAWYLDPSSIPLPRGFLPHRDRTLMPFSETQEPAYFTMWIALTDATLDNGCIRVLPATADPEYKSQDDTVTASWNESAEQALPCSAGTVLGWTGRLLHYGGQCTRDAVAPRVSLACAASTLEFEDPDMRVSLAHGDLPTLAERVRTIAVQLWSYDNKSPLSPSMRQLLQALEGWFETHDPDTAASQ